MHSLKPGKAITVLIARDLLDRLAKETGGRAFYPKSAEHLSDTVNDIMRDLHTQYTVGYSPANNPKSKPYRKINVTITGAKGRDKRTVITRPGYTVQNNPGQRKL